MTKSRLEARWERWRLAGEFAFSIAGSTPPRRQRCQRAVVIWLAVWLGLLAWWNPDALAQLAITEVMSQESINVGTNRVASGSDWWELTNFGAQTNDLTNYYFTDNSPTSSSLIQAPYTNLLIAPGESIVFVRTDKVTNETQFRAWWGPCLANNVQVRFYPKSPGFDAGSDGLHLYAPGGTLVDKVEFGTALRGVSFVYQTNSGDFGAFSTLGTCGACQAATADDIGSPGTTCGPVPLWLVGQPTNLTVCAGMEATFSARALGLPRPHYQWFFKGVPLAGGTASTLTITNARPTDAGQYEVEVSNGLTILPRAGAILTVSTNLSSPSILLPPTDFEVYPGQTAWFSVTACAFPLAAAQWFSNSTPIMAATNRVLILPNCSLSMSGTVYCVRMQNSLGFASACARLAVAARPQLKITELMAAESVGCPEHHDWFELTNYGSNAVNLLGYRFSDHFSLEGAFTNTRQSTIRPGESVIFVERMTSEDFARWWGAENLPPGLQVLPFVGLGFAQIPTGLDGLYMWNAAATDPFDALDSKSYESAVPGVSLYPSSLDPFTYLDIDSTIGVVGAFRSVECADIGSPGFTHNPAPTFLSISRDTFGVTLRWHAVEGKSYLLKYKELLSQISWSFLSTLTATNSIQTATDETIGSAEQRFYALEEQP